MDLIEYNGCVVLRVSSAQYFLDEVNILRWLSLRK
jgi:hypothetical protein